MKNLNYKPMKRFVFALLMLLTLSMNAQDDLAVKFLGIPVDGDKSELISKLKKKGFIYNYDKDYLTGKFNGDDVLINVMEYNGKVCRVLVADNFTSNETDIIIRFNNLIDQFENNGKYFGENEMIDYKENIQYEISQHNKRYEAIYFQKSENDKKLEDCKLDISYSEVNEEFINNFHKSCVDYSKSVGDDYYNMYIKGLNEIQNITNEQLFEYDKNWMESACISLQMTVEHNRVVWFMIEEEEDAYRKYRILLFYENRYNMPNGEDL